MIDPAGAPEVDASVLIPVLNELEGLDHCREEVVRAMEASGRTFEIVFVNDGSTDGSDAKLRAFAEADRRITWIDLLYNVGQQRAMYAGLAHCRGRAVITYDSDLQFHPECLSALADKILAGYDIAGGVRAGRKDSLVVNRVPSLIGRWLINRALRIHQLDFGGVKAYSARLVRILLSMRPVHVVIPAMAYSVTRNWIEIPVRHEARRTGHSKWALLSRIELYLDIFTLYARRPFAWMMVLGLASVAASALLGLGILAYRLVHEEPFGGLIIFFDVFLFTAGAFLFSLSLIGEFVVRSVRNTQFLPDQVVAGVHRQGAAEAGAASPRRGAARD